MDRLHSVSVLIKPYVQSGEGILPVHYLLDEDRRPQLITFGLIAWALTDIS